jgi:vacuolar-type H+-ATPase subunit I/STV1
MKIEISNGELLDKLSILEIKEKNISEPTKLENIKNEFNELKPLANIIFNDFSPQIKDLYSRLSEVNNELWVIEDDIRECERNKNFKSKFIELARSVYFTNDKRSVIKKEINILTKSGLIEEKSYEDYK